MNRVQVIYKGIDEIFQDAKNPRRNDAAVPSVAESIRQFGFKVPIVISEEGQIVAGHTRYKAAKWLGLQSVPCIVADWLTGKQLKAFQLADNKTGELATWDAAMLNMELDELASVFDMSVFGFDMAAADKEKKKNEEKKKADFVVCPRCGKKIPKKQKEILNDFCEQEDDECG